MIRFTGTLSAILVLFCLVGCDNGEELAKEPEKGSNETRIRVFPPGYIFYNSLKNSTDLVPDAGADKIGGATVRLFATEADYFLNEKPVHEFLTSASQDTFIYDFKETYYWVRAEKGKLNNLRQANGLKKSQLVQPLPCCGMDIDVALSTTPTKLRITVVDQGVAVQGATVQLYFSESDYTNNIPAQSNRNEVAPSYGSSFLDPNGFYANIEKTLKIYFNGLTNTAGEVYFDNLEPRQYWFKVTKGNKSNSLSTIKTFSALPDNPDITTTLTIGIGIN